MLPKFKFNTLFKLNRQRQKLFIQKNIYLIQDFFQKESSELDKKRTNKRGEIANLRAILRERQSSLVSKYFIDII